ncbi:hypothetical protein B0H11DRAFT_2248995 [Mycena galericulata]|nr:hypothetical protein B0H11DRAFT_2248995 [Mycena galericulata]
MATWLASYRTPTGTALDPQYALDGSTKLVVLNSSPPLPRRPLAPENRGALRQFNGQMMHGDFAVWPDRETGNRPIRPFIPAQDGCWAQNTHRDWAFQWNAQLVVPEVAPYRFTAEQRTSIGATIQEAVAWGAEVQRVYASHGYQMPAAPDVTALSRMYKDRPTFNAAVWDVRRAVLSLYAYVSCCLRHDPRWREKHWAGTFVGDIDKLGLLTRPVRGIFLGASQLNERTVRQWMDLGVPVHYAWPAGTPPPHVDTSYAPDRIGAYNLAERIEEQHRAALARRGHERKANRAEAVTSGVQKRKKKWLKQAVKDGAVQTITAPEGKRLAEEHPVDMSRSRPDQDVATVLLWRDVDDSSDDEMPPYAATSTPSSSNEAGATGVPTGWPTPSEAYTASAQTADTNALMSGGANDAPLAAPTRQTDMLAEAMNDEDALSLGDDTDMPDADPDLDASAAVDAAMPDSSFAERMLEDDEAVVLTPTFAERMPEPVRSQPLHRSSSPPRLPRAMRGPSRDAGSLEPRGRRPMRHDPYAAARERRRSLDDDRRNEPSADRSWPVRPRTPSLPRRPATPPPQVSAPADTVPHAAPSATAPAPALDAIAAVSMLDPNAMHTFNAAQLIAALVTPDTRDLLIAALKAERDGLSLAEVAMGHPQPHPTIAQTGTSSTEAPTTPAPTPVAPTASNDPTPAKSTGRNAKPERPPRPTPDRALVSRIALSLAERFGLPTADDHTLAARLGDPDREQYAAAQRDAAADWMTRALSWNDVPVDGTMALSSGLLNANTRAAAPPVDTRLTWDARTEVRARIWVCKDGRLSMADILTRAFRAGCRLQAFTPMTELEWRMRQQPHFRSIPPLPQTKGTSIQVAALQEYLHNVEEVLSRPHARAALLEGGLLWRIAIEWGPRWQVERLLQHAEPTEGHTYFDPAVGGVAYCLSQNEVDALRGLTQAGMSLWPPLEFWHRYDRWLGEWTPGNESWFVQRALCIRHGSELKTLARSSTVWRSRVRQLNIEVMQSNEAAGRCAEAEFILQTMDEEFPLALADIDMSRV